MYGDGKSGVPGPAPYVYMCLLGFETHMLIQKVLRRSQRHTHISTEHSFLIRSFLIRSFLIRPGLHTQGEYPLQGPPGTTRGALPLAAHPEVTRTSSHLQFISFLIRSPLFRLPPSN